MKSCQDSSKIDFQRAKYSYTSVCGASKGFMKVLKAFIKLFEALQRSVKIEV